MAYKNFPKGAKVEFRFNDDLLIPNTPLLLEEDLTITLNSDFAPLFGGGQSSALTVLGGFVGSFSSFEFSGQFKQFGFQAWTKTDPASFSLMLTLAMKTDATKDVLDPAKVLMKLPLPDDISARNDNDWGRLIAPGPTILDTVVDKTMKNSRKTSCKIGPFNFPSVVIKRVEPTFSFLTDQNQIPIWCKLKIDVQTVFTATSYMIDQFGV